MRPTTAVDEKPVRPPEEWRGVLGLEDRYQVSNLGRVRSLDHYSARKTGGGQVYKGKLLKGMRVNGKQPYFLSLIHI